MGRKIDYEKDKKVLSFLKRRTWKETQIEFNISSRTIKNIKDRNSKKFEDINQVDYKKVAKQFLSLFIDLQSQKLKNITISNENWNATIQKHLDFVLMEKLKEDLQ